MHLFLFRENAENLTYELGPAQDHNEDKTSKMQFPVVHRSYSALSRILSVSNVGMASGFEARLSGPDNRFDEGLRRCFQFWYMIEVTSHNIQGTILSLAERE